MKFSVIIPCRDDQTGLDRAVLSVLNQSIDDVEVIVVDDGSQTPLSVVDHQRVKLLRRNVAGGPAAARNLGLDNAEGEIVGWCDSDDFFTPNRLEIAERLHGDADIVVVGQGRASHLTSHASVPESLEQVLDRTSPHLGATTVRRRLCLGLDDRFLACQDVEWWIRTIEQGGSFASVTDVGYVVDSDDRVRLLNSPTARLDFSYSLLEQHADFYERHLRAKAFRWLRISVMEKREGNTALAWLALQRSIRAHPTALAAKEGVRLARASIRPRRTVTPISTFPLPPMSRLRAREIKPLMRGTAESRQCYESTLISAVSSMSPRFPKVVRGRTRRAATKIKESGTIGVKTAWGVLPLEDNEVRLIAPYADEPLELALLARYLQPGMTAIDIGANRGWYSLMFSARVGASGSVIAVEPDPRMLRRLETLRALNQLEGVLTIVDSAVAGESGTRQLTLNAEPSLNHLEATTDVEASRTSISVTAVSYVDLLRQHRVKRVDLLKIDVEGAESEVLASVVACGEDALLPAVIMFEFEPHHWVRHGQLSFTQTAEVLAPRYSLFAIDYSRGALAPINDIGHPTWTGRNILAVHRTHIGELPLSAQ